jgi:hypothetical protein
MTFVGGLRAHKNGKIFAIPNVRMGLGSGLRDRRETEAHVCLYGVQEQT